MKKDLFKKPLMISLALCLATSVNVFGSANPDVTEITTADDIVITGTSSVKNPVYKVIIPTDAGYNVTIDPFEKKEIGNQLYSEPMPIINKSDSAVKVRVQVTLPASTGGSNDKTLAYKAKNDVNQSNANVNEAQIYAGLNPALEVTTNSDFTINKVTKNTTYEAALYEAPTSGKNSAELEFALEKAIYAAGEVTASSVPTGLAAAGKGVATYRFVGRLNPYTTWKDGDLKPTAKYIIEGLSDTKYKNTRFLPEGANLVNISNAEDVTTTALPSITSATPNVSLAIKPEISYTLNFGADIYAGDAFKAVYLDNTMLGDAAYAYNATTKTVTFKKDAPFYSTIASTPGAYKIIVLFNNGAKAVGTLTVVA